VQAELNKDGDNEADSAIGGGIAPQKVAEARKQGKRKKTDSYPLDSMRQGQMRPPKNSQWHVYLLG
jgi:hypothetical protein